MNAVAATITTRPSAAEENSTLFVRSLPPTATSDTLSEFFSDICPVKHTVVVTDPATKISKGFGFVTFALAEDAQKALKEVRSGAYKLEGRVLRVDFARKRERHSDDKEQQGGTLKRKRNESAPVTTATPSIIQEVDQNGKIIKRRPRLIVRNLPWSVRDNVELAKLFSPYGKVVECLIPRKAGGRMSGFAFVTLRKQSSAVRAIKEVNGKVINGRTVAVDFAVEKTIWEKHVNDGLELGNENMDTDDEDNSDDEQNVDNSDNEVSIKSESDNDDISIKSEPVDDDEIVNYDDVIIKSESKDDVSIKAENDDDDASAKSESESEEDDEEAKPATAKPMRDPSVKDQNTESTVFIRNLSYSTTTESLTSHFSENFGAIKYALPVIDRETELPRGTAFVCFKNKDDYAVCLAGAPKQVASNSILVGDNIDARYVLDSRVLSITPAVARTQATKLMTAAAASRLAAAAAASGAADAGKSDKRNIFLLNEGRVTSGSALAAAMTKQDMQIREQSLALRRKLLASNPSLHLSLTRLAVRNMARGWSEADLKLLARHAVVAFAEEVKAGTRAPLTKEELARSKSLDQARGQDYKKRKKFGVVKQAKVVVEDKSTGTGRSRGYGFIEYATHRLALMGLRWLNARELGLKDIEKWKTQPGTADGNDNADDDEGSPKKKQKLQKNGKKAAALVDKEDMKKRRLVVEFAIENVEVVKRRQAREDRARQKAKAPKSSAAAESI
ncbi:uncharacterized protein V1518DRAFT_436330 [Limtongia smithiae]|uniref:uncharacterized protein n=1 Tax=Limtongia smithiae TaxID=1125753 RepID=UPI0034CE8985